MQRREGEREREEASTTMVRDIKRAIDRSLLCCCLALAHTTREIPYDCHVSVRHSFSHMEIDFLQKGIDGIMLAVELEQAGKLLEALECCQQTISILRIAQTNEDAADQPNIL